MENTEIFGFNEGILHLFYVAGGVDGETNKLIVGFADGLGFEYTGDNPITPEIEEKLAESEITSNFFLQVDPAYGLGLFLEKKIGEKEIVSAEVSSTAIIFRSILFNVKGEEVPIDVVVVEEMDENFIQVAV